MKHHEITNHIGTFSRKVAIDSLELWKGDQDSHIKEVLEKFNEWYEERCYGVSFENMSEETHLEASWWVWTIHHMFDRIEQDEIKGDKDA